MLQEGLLVVDKEGKIIIMIFDSMLATKHIPKALEAVKKLTSSKSR
jgi:peroxiredoxin Q/BCP